MNETEDLQAMIAEMARRFSVLIENPIQANSLENIISAFSEWKEKNPFSTAIFDDNINLIRLVVSVIRSSEKGMFSIFSVYDLTTDTGVIPIANIKVTISCAIELFHRFSGVPIENITVLFPADPIAGLPPFFFAGISLTAAQSTYETQTVAN